MKSGSTGWSTSCLVIAVVALAQLKIAQAEPVEDTPRPASTIPPSEVGAMGEPVRRPEPRAEEMLERAERDKVEADSAKAKALEDKAKAQEQAKQSEQVAKDAQIGLAEVKDGKLMSFGITGGTALTMQVPAWTGQRGAKITSVDYGPTVYVMILPGYWTSNQMVRSYCASAWTSRDVDTASRAAGAVALKEGQRHVERIANAMRAGHTDDEIVSMFLAEQSSEVESGPSYKKVVQITREALTNTEEAEKLRTNAEKRMGDLIWNQTRGTTCWARQFGVWLGMPANFSATTLLDEGAEPSVELEREIVTKGALGVGYSPNAYLSVLAGVALGTIREQETAATTGAEASAGRERTIWALSFGVGGNLDLIGLLVK